MEFQSAFFNVFPNSDVSIEIPADKALGFPINSESLSHLFLQNGQGVLVAHLENSNRRIIHSTGKQISIVLLVPCLIYFTLMVESEYVLHLGRRGRNVQTLIDVFQVRKLYLTLITTYLSHIKMLHLLISR